MCKNTTNNSVGQQKTLFSLPEPAFGKKIKVDFSAPDISANGGLLLARSSKNTLPSIMPIISLTRRMPSIPISPIVRLMPMWCVDISPHSMVMA